MVSPKVRCAHFWPHVLNAVWSKQSFPIPGAGVVVFRKGQTLHEAALQLLFPKRFPQILSVLNLFMSSDMNSMLSVRT